jgi:effector-associated domain 8 (EAD8)-containing protein
VLKLATDDRKTLIGLLERLEELDTEDERRNALVSAGLEELVPKIDLSGSPEGAVARIVDYLAQHTRVAPEREPLELFIGWAKGVTGVEQQRTLEDILSRMRQRGSSGETPEPPKEPPPRPPRSQMPLVIGSGIAALAGLALVIATFAGGGDMAPVAKPPHPDHPEHRVSAAELVDDPNLRASLVGEVELPPDWPGWTRPLKFTPQALVGVRTITATGRTIQLHDVRPAPRAPDELALRVVGGERIEIAYDDGTLACFIPPDTEVRVEAVDADPVVQTIEYKIGYVRSTWNGRGAVRACLGYGQRASIKPSTIKAGMHFRLPDDHRVTLVAVDGSNAMPCKNKKLMRVVTMSAIVPDTYFGAIPIHDSRIDRLVRDKNLGVTCEPPRDTLDYDKFKCSLSEDSFDCHRATADE